MSSTEPWDYVLAAAQTYAQTNAESIDEGNGATAFGEPIVYWMNRAAADAALDYAKMVEMGVEPYVARLSVQLGTDLVMAVESAREILGYGYDAWRDAGGRDEGTFGYPR